MILSFRGEIGSGKSTAAEHLVKRWNFKRVSFAEPLKLEVFEHLWRNAGTFGQNDDVWVQFRKDTGIYSLFPAPDVDFPTTDLYYISDAEKIAWVNANKSSLGPLLQWWGTEYRRGQNENYWLDKFVQSVCGLPRVVVDDARFDNELDMVCDMGGKHVYILNPKASALAAQRNNGEVRNMNHASEKLNDPMDPRHFTVLGNFGTLRDFKVLVDGLMVALFDYEFYAAKH